MRWTDAELAQLACALEPVLRDVLGLAQPGIEGGPTIEPGTVLDTFPLDGSVAVRVASGATLTVPVATVFPARGERVYVQFMPGHGALVVGHVAGVATLLGKPDELAASPGAAGVGGLDLGISTAGLVQANRVVLVTGHCQLDTPSGALQATLDVLDNGVLLARAAQVAVAAAGTGLLHGAVLSVGPTAGPHAYTLRATTSTGTVVVQPAGYVLAQDVGSSTMP